MAIWVEDVDFFCVVILCWEVTPLVGRVELLYFLGSASHLLHESSGGKGIILSSWNLINGNVKLSWYP